MTTERALVLARGLGTRMRAADSSARLSDAQQRAADAGLKPMMPIHGRPFLDFVLSALADVGLREVALVVAPEHDALRSYYLEQAPPARIRISFVIQDEPLGTAKAVLAAEAWAGDGPFLAMNGDNLYPLRALADLAALDEPGMPAFDAADLVRSSNIPPDRLRAFATVEVENGYLTGIVEKPRDVAPVDDALVSMNCWRFDSRIFAACRDVPRSARGEFELPEAVGVAIRRGVRFRAIRAAGPVLDLSRRADANDIERRLAGVVPRV
jgi:dTDP-glucose pyrophosphorylase